MPKISVIVSVYNVEKYLSNCIDSILAQTFTDCKLLLIDDGSTDGDICDEYKKKDKRIHVIHQKNQGVSAAMNKGIDKSIGKYLAFIDSDDSVDKKYFEILYNNIILILTKILTDADMSLCNIVEVHNNNVNSYNILNNITAYTNKEAIENLFLGNTYHRCSVSAKLIKKSIVEKSKFLVWCAFTEDKAVLYKWYYSSKKIIQSDSILYYYHINNGSTCNRRYDYYMLDAVDTAKEILDFFKETEIDFPDLYYKYIHIYAYTIGIHMINILTTYNDKITAKKLKNMLKNVINEKSIATF